MGAGLVRCSSCSVILLAALLVWTPVLLDCQGKPESIAAYQVRGQHVRLLGWTTEDPPEPIYSARAPLEASAAPVATSYPLSGEPLRPGDVAWWELEAIDTAGNMGECSQ